MSYSVQDYLRRETTEKLETFLKNYYEGALTEDFSDTIPLVQKELQRRKNQDNRNNTK